MFYSTSLLAICSFYWVFPLYPQPENYHDFSGDQMLLGIPNFMNVASNIFYIIASIWGLYKVKNSYFMLPTILWQLFFITIMGVGIGSSYYHFSPATNTFFLGIVYP